MSYTATYNFPAIRRNDTFRAMAFQINKDITDWAIRMWIKPSGSRVAIREFSVGTGITIIDAANGSFQIDQFDVDLVAATYLYDMEFTDADGIKRTYLTGSFTVDNDITR